MKIGVFDSGVGGKSVAEAIKKAYPEAEVILEQDTANLPYGTKENEELFCLVKPILDRLSKAECDVIVVACNTVTTNIISRLREAIKTPLIGIEPMIKPASSMTKTKVVTVCATPSTLRSERYNYLKREYGAGVKFYEPDCSKWAEMIEKSDLDMLNIKSIVSESKKQNADVIVLGCTHYHWISEEIEELAGGGVAVIHPEQAVISRLKQVLQQLD